MKRMLDIWNTSPKQANPTTGQNISGGKSPLLLLADPEQVFLRENSRCSQLQKRGCPVKRAVRGPPPEESTLNSLCHGTRELRLLNSIFNFLLVLLSFFAHMFVANDGHCLQRLLLLFLLRYHGHWDVSNHHDATNIFLESCVYDGFSALRGIWQLEEFHACSSTFTCPTRFTRSTYDDSPRARETPTDPSYPWLMAVRIYICCNSVATWHGTCYGIRRCEILIVLSVLWEINTAAAICSWCKREVANLSECSGMQPLLSVIGQL